MQPGSSKMSKENHNDAIIFQFPNKIDIASIVSIADNIKATYTSKNIIFNAKSVEKITTPGIQILLATILTAKSRRGHIKITEPSEIFINNIATLGFASQLQEWIDLDE
jgi:hypothetical protein